LAATLTTILDAIRENVISLPSATEGRLEEFVQQAQRKAEAAFQWINGEMEMNVSTTAGSNILQDLDRAFLWPIDDPWYVTGDVGSKVEMEWLPSISDRAKEYIDSSNSDYRSSPKALRIVRRPVTAGSPGRIEVYPRADASNTIGEFSVAGEYKIRAAYHSRGALLEVGGSIQTNYLTENEDLALYIEEWASGKAMLMNHDYENGSAMLLQAAATLKEAKKIEKKRKVPVLRWTPRRDVHASRRQRRAI